MVEAEVSEYTIDDFVKDMRPSILSCRQPETILNLYVFWSKGEEEEEDYSSPKKIFSSSMIDTSYWGSVTAETLTKNYWYIEDYFKSALCNIFIKNFNVLVQFWVPGITTCGRYVLTTSNQPFGLKRIKRGLCEYRKHCSTLEIKVFTQDEEDDELGGGSLIAQVFKQEESFDICKCYHPKHQTQSDFALKCDIRRSLILPLFNTLTQYCTGVLELVDTSINSFRFDDLLHLAKRIAEEGNRRTTSCLNLQIKENIEEDRVIVFVHEMNKAMQVVCTIHQLPLAQIWISGCTSIAITYADSPDKRSCYSPYLSCSDKFSSSIYDDRMTIFNFHCIDHPIGKGQGVVGEALLYHKPCFCKDVNQLPQAQYPLAYIAAKYGLTGCYAICLHSTTTRTRYNRDYVLEFYLPPNWNAISGDPQTFLKSILATVKNQLPGFKICSAGEEPCVEVGKVSLNYRAEPDPAIVSHTTSVQPVSESFANKRETVLNEVVGETAIDIIPSFILDRLEKTVEISGRDSRKEVGEEAIVEAATNDDITTRSPSPTPESLQNETKFVQLLVDNSTVEAAIKNEVNEIEVVQLSDDESTEEALLQNESNVLVAEQNNIAATSSERICRIETLERENKTNDSGKKLDDVAYSRGVTKNELNVAIVEQSSVAVASSLGTISSRAETLESIYRTPNFSINRVDLEKRYGMTLKEVAQSLGVSRSTVQRACRYFKIERWPLPKTVSNASSTCDAKNVKEVVLEKRKKVNNNTSSSSSTCNPKHEIEEVVPKKRKVVNPSCSSPLPMQETPTAAHPIAIVPPQKDVGTVTTYVTYGDDTVLFLLPFSSRMPDLRGKVTQRLPPLIDVSFNIKYQDEENEWILIACEEDLEECISISRSLSTKIRMVVVPVTNQTP